MAVIAAVLVGAATLITRITEADLVDRVDAQLRSAQVPRALRPGPEGPGPGADSALSSLYVGVVRGDTLVPYLIPNVTGDDPRPEIPIDRVAAVAEDGRPRLFTVGSDSGVRFRVLARPERRVVLVLGLPLGDVDASISRLVGLEVVATTLVLAVLGLVTWWVVRLGVWPVQRMTKTAA